MIQLIVSGKLLNPQIKKAANRGSDPGIRVAVRMMGKRDAGVRILAKFRFSELMVLATRRFLREHWKFPYTRLYVCGVTRQHNVTWPSKAQRKLKVMARIKLISAKSNPLSGI
jgi:hypothetical protein